MPTNWPTGDDLIAWIGASSSDELTAQAEDIMLDAIDDALARIPVAALSSSNRPGGSAPDCPRRLRRALIMHAGRTYARRASQAGYQLTAEVVARITSVDPDVTRYMSTLTNWPEA